MSDDTATSYASRATAFDEERTFRLTPGGLAWTAPERALTWGEVTEIRLGYAPSRFESNRYVCRIRRRRGRTMGFSSLHYVSLGNFEDRGARYSAFVTRMAAEARSANPRIRFRAGDSPVLYWVNAVFIALSLAGLVLVLWLVGVDEALGAPSSNWVKIMVVIFLIPTVLFYFIKNRSRDLDGAKLPTDLLPKQTGAPT